MIPSKKYAVFALSDFSDLFVTQFNDKVDVSLSNILKSSYELPIEINKDEYPDFSNFNHLLLYVYMQGEMNQTVSSPLVNESKYNYTKPNVFVAPDKLNRIYENKLINLSANPYYSRILNSEIRTNNAGKLVYDDDSLFYFNFFYKTQDLYYFNETGNLKQAMLANNIIAANVPKDIILPFYSGTEAGFFVNGYFIKLGTNAGPVAINSVLEQPFGTPCTEKLKKSSIEQILFDLSSTSALAAVNLSNKLIKLMELYVLYLKKINKIKNDRNNVELGNIFTYLIGYPETKSLENIAHNFEMKSQHIILEEIMRDDFSIVKEKINAAKSHIKIFGYKSSSNVITHNNILNCINNWGFINCYSGKDIDNYGSKIYDF